MEEFAVLLIESSTKTSQRWRLLKDRNTESAEKWDLPPMYVEKMNILNVF